MTAQVDMKRSRPPFRADHVGSLLRPPALKQAREAHKRGEISAEQLRAAEDAAVREVVRLQEDVGLQSMTDGELRRGSWHMDFLYQIGGVTRVQDNLKVQFHNEKGDIEFTPSALRVTGRLKYEKMIFGEDFAYPEVRHARHAEAHHSRAEHDSLSRRQVDHRPRACIRTSTSSGRI